MVYIETPHLLLRDWEEEDILPFVRMNSDKEVMEFFLTTLTEEETMAFYCRIRKEFEEYGYGLYAVECKETRNFLGYVGFHNIAFESDFYSRSGNRLAVVPGCMGKRDMPQKPLLPVWIMRVIIYLLKRYIRSLPYPINALNGSCRK